MENGEGAISYGAGHEPANDGSGNDALEPWQRSIIRDVALIAALILVGLALSIYADAANPDFALVISLEDVYEAALDRGSVQEAAAANPEARLYEVEHNGESAFFVTHTTPVGRGVCYGLRWQPGDPQPATGRFFAEQSCTPGPTGTFAPGFPALPSERATAWWFVPAMAVLVAVGLFALIRITFVALRPSPAKPR